MELKKENIKDLDYDASLAYYMETGICDWCEGDRLITYDAGMNGEDGRHEHTMPCPVCNNKEEDDQTTDN